MRLRSLVREQTAGWLIDGLNSVLEECYQMTSKAKKTTVGGKGFVDIVFVEVRLAGDEFDMIEEEYPTADASFDAMSYLIEGGYKISFGFNPANGMAICSITCRKEGSNNEGKCLTSFAVGWYDALRVGLYKHFILLKEEWDNAKTVGGNRNNFG